MDQSSILIYKKKKKKKKNQQGPLALTYDSRLEKASTAVKEQMSSLHMDEKLCKIFPDPLLISFRRNRSLRDLPDSARLPTPKTDEQSNGLLWMS